MKRLLLFSILTITLLLAACAPVDSPVVTPAKPPAEEPGTPESAEKPAGGRQVSGYVQDVDFIQLNLYYFSPDIYFYIYL